MLRLRFRHVQRFPERLRVFAGCAVLLLVGVFAGACGGDRAAPERLLYAFDGPIMGTGYTVQIVRPGEAPLDEARQQELRALLLERMDEVNRLMSTYLDESELSRFNRTGVDEEMVLSPPTVEVLRAAFDIAEKTGGALDVTIGPLVNAWGFGPAAIDSAPAAEELERLAQNVGHETLRFESVPGTLAKTHPEVYVDLSSVAKGYAVDRVYEALRAEGLDDVFVEIGGETRVHGSNPDGMPWRLGIERPQALRAVQRIIALDNAALATSGDYRNYREENGRRLSHLIDPRTARPIDHRLASVSVVRPTCLEADGLSTALMILGPDEGYAYAEREGIAALFLVREGDDFVERASPTFTATYMPGASTAVTP
ncbi:MAG: FAD:protein FMN transferase [Acidobacteriota bacterium]